MKSKELEKLCDCECHIKGRSIMHFMECCDNCYVPYLKYDENGNVVIDYESEFIINLTKEGK